MVDGPLGIWPFPIVNLFFAEEDEPDEDIDEEDEVPDQEPDQEPDEKFSIMDHKVLSGSPNYTGNFEITADKNATPWKIEMVYDIVMTEEIFDENGNLSNSSTVQIPKGGVLYLRSDVIDNYIKDKGGKIVTTQDKPR